MQCCIRSCDYLPIIPDQVAQDESGAVIQSTVRTESATTSTARSFKHDIIILIIDVRECHWIRQDESGSETRSLTNALDSTK